MNVFRPSSPPIISTPDTLLNAAVATKSEFMFCVPALIEVYFLYHSMYRRAHCALGMGS